MYSIKERNISSSSYKKLSPRVGGLFKVVKHINENVYKVELFGECNISATFNVIDLSPYHANEDV